MFIILKQKQQKSYPAKKKKNLRKKWSVIVLPLGVMQKLSHSLNAHKGIQTLRKVDR